LGKKIVGLFLVRFCLTGITLQSRCDIRGTIAANAEAAIICVLTHFYSEMSLFKAFLQWFEPKLQLFEQADTSVLYLVNDVIQH
jgi:hypothetical protein